MKKKVELRKPTRVEFTVTCQMTVEQTIAFTSMLKKMEQCGHTGTSKVVGFYADGDGGFQPMFKFSGNIPEVKPEPYYLKDDMLIYDEDSLEPVDEEDKEVLKKLDLHKQ